MPKPKVGNKAPVFSLPNQDGEKVSLADYKGKKVVLYFYPKDNTSGCTKEACEFTDNKAKFSRKNAVIIGVSPDSPESHTKFIEKFKIPFELLSDESKTAAKKYDVWKQKSMYGRSYMGIERSTFIIDERGKLAREFRKVKVNGHVDEVLEALKEC